MYSPRFPVVQLMDAGGSMGREDTNVVSELRKHKPHSAVVAWLTDLHEDQIFVSLVTLGECRLGLN